MIYTHSFKLSIGNAHERKVKEDVITYRTVRTVYGKRFDVLGYISKPAFRRAGWRAYNQNGESLGEFTKRQFAIDAIVEARL